MSSEHDDDVQTYERLRRLGLLHLADKPAELAKELERLKRERAKTEAEAERERRAIRERLKAEQRTASGAPSAEVEPSSTKPSSAMPTAARGTEVKGPVQKARGPSSPKPSAPSSAGPAKRTKSSTLLVGTIAPGTCTTCRHANQETADFEEGHLYCTIAREPRTHGHECDVTRPLPRSMDEDVERWSTYWMYQPYDGANGTYGVLEDARMLAEDADDTVRRAVQADVPFIPAKG